MGNRASPIVIAWRLLLAGPFYASAAIACFFVLLMWGREHAKRTWSDIT